MQSDSTEVNQIQQKQTTPSELVVITFNFLKTLGKIACTLCDWFWFSFCLVEKLTQDF